MGMTPVPLVHSLLLFALKNLLVMLTTPLVVLTISLAIFVAWFLVFLEWGMAFLIVIESIGDVVPLVVFVPMVIDSKGGRRIEIFWRPKA